MFKVDSHQHFWVFDAVKDAWITDDMSCIQRNFLPDDYSHLLIHHNIRACVAVQAHHTEGENDFLLTLSQGHSFIKGIVGWVDLQAPNIEERLQYYQQYPLIKGFRHLLQDETDMRFMLGKRFKNGLSLLSQYGYSYDILIKPLQLPYAIELVKEFPQQRFVIDHLAKPAIKSQEIVKWLEYIQEIAVFENVYCKVSGFCTEANWYRWTLKDVQPFLMAVFDAFGINRVMYGSDWPVCTLAGGINKTIGALNEFLASFSETDGSKFWSQNAIRFYNLSI